jgi:hypothetical protein
VNSTDPHYTLSANGIATSSNPATNAILYQFIGCLCEDPSGCQQPGDLYYDVTRQGLDALMQEYFGKAASHSSVLRSLLTSFFHPDHVQAMVNLGEGPQQNVTSPPWKFIFEIGQAEIEGGIILLRNSYLNVLNNLYNQCLLLQIIQLVIAVVLAALYIIIMVLPFVRDAWVETRRIAELLAQLPPEIDVESLVSRTMTTAKKVTAQRAGSASIMSRRGGGDDDDGLLVSAPSMGRMGMLARKQSTNGFDF